MKSVHLYIAGRVQGVGFRAFTRRNARKRQLSGWVRNLSGGEVEIKAAGSKRNIDQFREKLQQGPPLGRVDNISSQPLTKEEAQSLPETFTIKPTQ